MLIGQLTCQILQMLIVFLSDQLSMCFKKMKKRFSVCRFWRYQNTWALPHLWYMATGTPSKDFVHLGEAHRLQFTPQQISCSLEPTRKGLLNREVCCQLPPFQKLGLDIFSDTEKTRTGHGDWSYGARDILQLTIELGSVSKSLCYQNRYRT